MKLLVAVLLPKAQWVWAHSPQESQSTQKTIDSVVGAMTDDADCVTLMTVGTFLIAIAPWGVHRMRTT
jgi:hypothetical protein